MFDRAVAQREAPDRGLVLLIALLFLIFNLSILLSSSLLLPSSAREIDVFSSADHFSKYTGVQMNRGDYAES